MKMAQIEMRRVPVGCRLQERLFKLLFIRERLKRKMRLKW